MLAPSFIHDFQASSYDQTTTTTIREQNIADHYVQRTIGSIFKRHQESCIIKTKDICKKREQEEEKGGETVREASVGFKTKSMLSQFLNDSRSRMNRPDSRSASHSQLQPPPSYKQSINLNQHAPATAFAACQRPGLLPQATRARLLQTESAPLNFAPLHQMSSEQVYSGAKSDGCGGGERSTIGKPYLANNDDDDLEFNFYQIHQQLLNQQELQILHNQHHKHQQIDHNQQHSYFHLTNNLPQNYHTDYYFSECGYRTSSGLLQHHHTYCSSKGEPLNLNDFSSISLTSPSYNSFDGSGSSFHNRLIKNNHSRKKRSFHHRQNQNFNRKDVTVNHYFQAGAIKTADSAASIPEPPIFTMIEDYQIASFPIAGEPHLCLPQLLQVLRRRFTLNRIIKQFEEFAINFASASGTQVVGLKRAKVLPQDSELCPLIKHSDADRICLGLYNQCYKGRSYNLGDFSLKKQMQQKLAKVVGHEQDDKPINLTSGDAIHSHTEGPLVSLTTDHAEISDESNKVASKITQAINISQNNHFSSTDFEDKRLSDQKTQANDQHETNIFIKCNIVKKINAQSKMKQISYDYCKKRDLLTNDTNECQSIKQNHANDQVSLDGNEVQNSILKLSKTVTSTLMIRVYHKCFGKCSGHYYPELYVHSKSICIECSHCHVMLNPRRFIGHTHGPKENHVCHWGFDSHKWRCYIRLAKNQCANNLDDDELLLKFQTLLQPASDQDPDSDEHDYEFDKCDGSAENLDKNSVKLNEVKQRRLNKFYGCATNVSSKDTSGNTANATNVAMWQQQKDNYQPQVDIPPTSNESKSTNSGSAVIRELDFASKLIGIGDGKSSSKRPYLTSASDLDLHLSSMYCHSNRQHHQQLSNSHKFFTSYQTDHLQGLNSMIQLQRNHQHYFSDGQIGTGISVQRQIKLSSLDMYGYNQKSLLNYNNNTSGYQRKRQRLVHRSLTDAAIHQNLATMQMESSSPELPIFIMIETYRIASFSIAGEAHLCLPQLLQFLRQKFSLKLLVSQFEEFMINFTSATANQVEGFKKACVLPDSAKSCPMIKRTDADRICLSLCDQCSNGKRHTLIDTCSLRIAQQQHETSKDDKPINLISRGGNDVAVSNVSNFYTNENTTRIKAHETNANENNDFVYFDQCDLVAENFGAQIGARQMNDSYHQTSSGSLLSRGQIKQLMDIDTLPKVVSRCQSGEFSINDKPSYVEHNPKTTILTLAKTVTSTLMIRVYHKCFGKCSGVYYPALFTDSKSICIECSHCHLMMAPRRFVGHLHGTKENNICHWGFNSYHWRHYIRLAKKQGNNKLHDDELLLQFKTLSQSPATNDELECEDGEWKQANDDDCVRVEDN